MKKIEIEIRAKIDDNKQVDFVSKLRGLGAERIKEDFISDTYYCPVSVKSFKEIEMDSVGSYSLRLREYYSDQEKTFELNTKQIINEGDHNAWEEHEITCSSASEINAILVTLGFKPFFELTKDRVTFRLNEMIIVVEDIQDFGLVVEVEIMSDENAIEAGKISIRKFFSEIGISEDEIFPKSVTNHLMKTKSYF